MTESGLWVATFSNADVAVVVDESKSKYASGEEVLAFVARTFERGDPGFAELYRALETEGAADWHGSARGRDTRGMFGTPNAGRILDLLEAAKSTLLWSAMDVGALREQTIEHRWRQILDDNPELRKVWDVRDPQARALFRFADYTFRTLERRLPPGTRVVMVVDRLSWLVGRERRAGALSPGLAGLGAGADSIEAMLWAVTDKQTEGTQCHLPLLGLVDSEAWAIQRLVTSPLPGGDRLLDRQRAWRERGSPEHERLLEQHELDGLFADHQHLGSLRDYWERWTGWVAGKKRAIRL